MFRRQRSEPEPSEFIPEWKPIHHRQLIPSSRWLPVRQLTVTTRLSMQSRSDQSTIVQRLRRTFPTWFSPASWSFVYSNMCSESSPLPLPASEHKSAGLTVAVNRLRDAFIYAHDIRASGDRRTLWLVTS